MKKEWSPWLGCIKKSEGCEMCPSFLSEELSEITEGKIIRNAKDFSLPEKRDSDGFYKIHSGERVAVCPYSDFFIEDGDRWRDEAWEIIRRRTDVDFIIITKRPERIRISLPEDWRLGWNNVTIGVCCENQRLADQRIPLLLEIPSVHKEIVFAPLTGPVRIGKYLDSGEIEHVCAGGGEENFPPSDYSWYRVLYEDCKKRKIPFEFFDTGKFFRKSGRTYRVPRAIRKYQALQSGLTYPPLLREIKTPEKCLTCEKNEFCEGCSDCGKCPGPHI